MNRSRIAEWILSLALPTERMTAALGDLEESAEECGQLWFWSCVIRLTAAKIWQDLSESPFVMLWLGVRGFIVSALAPAACMVVIFVLTVILQLRGYSDIRNHDDWMWTLFAILWSAWIYRTGQAIASRTPGREIAASLAVAAIGWIAILTAAIFVHQVVAPQMPVTQVSVAFAAMGLVYDLDLLLGAMEMRRQRISGKQSA